MDKSLIALAALFAVLAMFAAGCCTVASSPPFPAFLPPVHGYGGGPR